MGAPDTFDVEGFVALLERLRDDRRSGQTMLAPGFDRRVEEAVPDAIALRPERRTVIVEGTRHERLIARHIAFGKSPDAARTWALGPDERNAVAIAATLDRADYALSL